MTLIKSKLEIIDIHSKQRKVIYQDHTLFEAPNWHQTDDYLIVNRDGCLFKINAEGSNQLVKINTEFATGCNNDHGISPDGKLLVVSHHDQQSDGQSVLYTLPIEGGMPKKVTQKYPSYWHGWSPDGQTLLYVAGRSNSDSFNIYSINVNGGEETQLTDTQGLDDGPEYSPDGNTIYFNSFQSGKMQIWKMDKDGKNQKQLVKSNHSDWFAHPSPDGHKVVFIRYIKDQIQKHPFGQDVQLMLLNLKNNELTELTEIFYGGQGSLNVPSWSPCGTKLAFVSYVE
ncbi:TolB family protein [Marinicellulosiphila megalodicopiae]|uniref:TolB family protein n=1 Tax=Marinicellulosiphila megalodicopiae TaxID=2724896 RepID=UPI003BB19F30